MQHEYAVEVYCTALRLSLTIILYCAFKICVKRVGLMLSVLTTKKTNSYKTTRPEEAFGGDEYIYYLHCGDVFMNVCICPNSSSRIYSICKIFLRSITPQ